MSLFVRPRLTMLASKEHHADLVPLTELIDAGKLTPSIDATYTLDQAQDAMRQLEAGTVRGKISIAMPSPVQGQYWAVVGCGLPRSERLPNRRRRPNTWLRLPRRSPSSISRSAASHPRQSLVAVRRAASSPATCTSAATRSEVNRISRVRLIRPSPGRGTLGGLLRDALEPTAVLPGAVLIAGTDRYWSLVRIEEVDDDGQVHFVSVPPDDPAALRRLARSA